MFGIGRKHKEAYKYNPETNEYETLASIPSVFTYGFLYGAAVIYDNDIYLIADTHLYKYDTELNTYTLITDALPIDFSNYKAHCIDDNIFMFTRTNCYKFNLTSQEIVKLNEESTPINVDNGSSVLYGTSIYLFGGTANMKKAYKYDTITNTYSELEDIPYAFYKGAISISDNTIYLIGGYGSNLSQAKFVIPLQEFDNNSLIIAQGAQTYKTQIYENKNIKGRLLYGFDDVAHNTTESGLDDTLPTYYGTGTEWVKFKN